MTNRLSDMCFITKQYYSAFKVDLFCLFYYLGNTAQVKNNPFIPYTLVERLRFGVSLASRVSVCAGRVQSTCGCTGAQRFPDP